MSGCRLLGITKLRNFEISSKLDLLTGYHLTLRAIPNSAFRIPNFRVSLTRQRDSEFRIPHSEFLRSRTGSV